MEVGQRLREIRQTKNLSQGDIEKRTGLLRCYISRVENGYTVPSVETLEKLASAFGVPLYQLFRDSTGPPQMPKLLKNDVPHTEWGASVKEALILSQFRRLFERMTEDDRHILLFMARKMADR